MSLTSNKTKLQTLLDGINALPVYEDHTELLPQLNTVNGGTAATTMAAAVNNTETLVDDETALITQIRSALEGKVGGSGSGGTGEAVLDTGELYGASTYGAAGTNYYYYSLEDIPNFETKRSIFMHESGTYQVYMFLTRYGSTGTFDMIGHNGHAVSPSFVSDNIIQSGTASYTYYAI